MGQVRDAAAGAADAYDTNPTLGTEEAAAAHDSLMAAGRMVAQRAEMHAGISSAEVEKRWEARSVESMTSYLALEEIDPSCEATWEALRVCARVQEGSDPDTAADLQRLSDGYKTALAEVRSQGGAVAWHDRSAKKARALFDEAAQVYPADWIDASNRRPAVIAKTSSARAHYADNVVGKVKVREIVTRHGSIPDRFGDPNLIERGLGSLTDVYTRDADQTGAPVGSTKYTSTEYEVLAAAPVYGPPPPGRGWEQVEYESYGGELRTTLRRPKMRMATKATFSAPEILVSMRSAPVGQDGHCVAIHELAHRFEASVPMIGQMESAFIIRRTTTDGVRDPLTIMYVGKREVTRADHFTNAYMGKDYGIETHHEVLSMGSEAIFAGTQGGLVGVGKNRRDDEMRAFILGVHAAARPKVN